MCFLQVAVAGQLVTSIVASFDLIETGEQGTTHTYTYRTCFCKAWFTTIFNTRAPSAPQKLLQRPEFACSSRWPSFWRWTSGAAPSSSPASFCSRNGPQATDSAENIIVTAWLLMRTAVCTLYLDRSYLYHYIIVLILYYRYSITRKFGGIILISIV